MRGPKPSYPIDLSAEEAKHLQQLIRAHSTPQTLAVRARIILRANAHPEQNNQQIAIAVGTTDRTVRTWRGRWVKTHSLADAGFVNYCWPPFGEERRARASWGQEAKWRLVAAI